MLPYRRHAELVFPAVGVILLAEFGGDLPLRVTALVLVIVCAVASPVFGTAVILVGASDPALFRAHVLGPLAVVDLLIGTAIVRAALVADRRRPNWVEWSAIGFLASGAVATAVAHSGSAPTAFGRIASYVVLGLVAGRAFRRGDRPLLARVFIGSQVGQALAAFAGITSTTTTGFPLGRYLGTLGDPAAFGIPIAFAAVLVAASRTIVRGTALRASLLIVLVIAVVGSATRSAWSLAAVGGLLIIAQRFGSGRPLRLRVALGVAVLAVLVAGTVASVTGAGALGLNPSSAQIRRHSIRAAWTYFKQHPLHPAGLGNKPVSTATGPTPASGNFIPDSSFEGPTRTWFSHRRAQARIDRADAMAGTRSLRVTASGSDVEQGVTVGSRGSPTPGLRGDTTYTFSIYVRGHPEAPLWLWVDEYNASGQWLKHDRTKVVAKGRSAVRGTGGWSRPALSWRTDSAAVEASLSVLTATETKTEFLLDAAQLERGSKATGYAPGPRNILRPHSVRVSPPYNTWLAVAFSLGVAAAVLLAVFASGSVYLSYRVGDTALATALAAMFVPSLTENFLYATSYIALMWLVTLGLTATAKTSVRRRATPDGPLGED